MCGLVGLYVNYPKVCHSFVERKNVFFDDWFIINVMRHDSYFLDFMFRRCLMIMRGARPEYQNI